MRRFLTTSTILASVLAVTAPASSANRNHLDAPASTHLDTLQRAPASAGVLVYRGVVTDQRTPEASPLFTYERRVEASPEGLRSAHITKDAHGKVIIAEQAELSSAYALKRFDAANRQLGYSGTVVLSENGRHLEYRIVEGGKITTASEDVDAPVVAGPSLHGFILQHWSDLMAGQVVPVRMIVMTKAQTYGFEIRRQSQADGRTSFSVAPSSLLVRLLVAPLTVTFDSATRNVLRYEGRVPPMRAVNGKLENLDARVDYTMNAVSYR